MTTEIWLSVLKINLKIWSQDDDNRIYPIFWLGKLLTTKCRCCVKVHGAQLLTLTAGKVRGCEINSIHLSSCLVPLLRYKMLKDNVHKAHVIEIINCTWICDVLFVKHTLRDFVSFWNNTVHISLPNI